MNYTELLFLVFTLTLSAYIISYAYWKRKIDLSAALASTSVGLITLLTVGPYWLYLILTFFVFGNLVTKFNYDLKKEKGVAERERTFRNVFGNGGAALLFGILYFLSGNNPLFLLGFLGAMASASADTFATEIGVVYEWKPRLITNFKKTKAGTNGAVSLPGTVAAVLGAATISLVPMFYPTPNLDKNTIFFIGITSGVIGAFTDSLVGATIEGKIKKIDNHTTNFIGTLIGGLTAIILFKIITP